MGARRLARRRPRRSSSPRSTRRRAPCWRATPGTRSSGAASRSPTCAGRQTAWTGDRTEFLGRNGTLDHPAALERAAALSGTVGAGLDPCGALQTTVELRPGERAEVTFLLGQGATVEEARALVARHRTADVDDALRAVERRWDDILSVVQVRTPDRSLDVLLNSLAALPGARVPRLGARGVLPGERRVRLPRPAPGRDGAHRVAARPRPRAPAARRGAAVRRGRRPALVAPAVGPRAPGRASRTTCSGCRTRRSHYLEVTGDLGLLDEVVPFLEGRRSRRSSTTPTSSPRCRTSARRSSSTAPARSTAACASAPTASRSWARATGTTA